MGFISKITYPTRCCLHMWCKSKIYIHDAFIYLYQIWVLTPTSLYIYMMNRNWRANGNLQMIQKHISFQLMPSWLPARLTSPHLECCLIYPCRPHPSLGPIQPPESMMKTIEMAICLPCMDMLTEPWNATIGYDLAPVAETNLIHMMIYDGFSYTRFSFFSYPRFSYEHGLHKRCETQKLT